MTQQTQILPDARCNRRETIQGPFGLMCRVYCVNCGHDGGLVTEDWAEHCFYLCDKCSEKYGSLANETQRVSDAQVRGELNAREQDPKTFDAWQKILEQSKAQAKERRRMGIKLFMVELVLLPEPNCMEVRGFRIPGKEGLVPRHELPIGAVWIKDNGHHVIVIPSTKDATAKTLFCPEEAVPSSSAGWTLTGTAPNITVTPSVFCNPNANPPGWHGWIRDGELIEA